MKVLVKEFLEGAKEAGAGTEVVYLKDKKTEYCAGCMERKPCSIAGGQQ
jgi:multimeric flavodoxin WrbA